MVYVDELLLAKSDVPLIIRSYDLGRGAPITNSHVPLIMWSRDDTSQNKNFVSTYIRPISIKLCRVVVYGGFPQD